MCKGAWLSAKPSLVRPRGCRGSSQSCFPASGGLACTAGFVRGKRGEVALVLCWVCFFPGCFGVVGCVFWGFGPGVVSRRFALVVGMRFAHGAPPEWRPLPGAWWGLGLCWGWSGGFAAAGGGGGASCGRCGVPLLVCGVWCRWGAPPRGLLIPGGGGRAAPGRGLVLPALFLGAEGDGVGAGFWGRGRVARGTRPDKVIWSARFTPRGEDGLAISGK